MLRRSTPCSFAVRNPLTSWLPETLILAFARILELFAFTERSACVLAAVACNAESQRVATRCDSRWVRPDATYRASARRAARTWPRRTWPGAAARKPAPRRAIACPTRAPSPVSSPARTEVERGESSRKETSPSTSPGPTVATTDGLPSRLATMSRWPSSMAKSVASTSPARIRKSLRADVPKLADALDAIALRVREVAEKRMVGLDRKEFVHAVTATPRSIRNAGLPSRSTESAGCAHSSRPSARPCARSSR